MKGVLELENLILALVRRLREDLGGHSKYEGDFEFEDLKASTPAPIACVDGGSSSIIATPRIGLSYVRIASLTVDARGRINPKLSEYVVYSRVGDRLVSYTILDIKGREVEVENPNVEVGREGIPLLDFERATLRAMTYLELLHASKLAGSGYKIVLRDGSLNVHPYPLQARLYADRIYGVSKTSSSRVISFMPPRMLEKPGPWISRFKLSPQTARRGIVTPLEYVVYDIFQCVAKLSPAGRPLVFEAFKVEDSIEDTIWRVKNVLSQILNFLDESGNYPYPLIEADRLASVKRSESRAVTLKILYLLEEFDPEIASTLNIYSKTMRTHEWGR